jgi:flagellar protein FlaF
VGFSVSGATVILFLGMVASLGIAYSGAFNAFEQVDNAYRDDADRVLDQQNTAVNVTNVSWDETGPSYLTVEIENTGSTSLSVEDTDLLVDNVYQETFENRTVDGNADTDLWLPGETLNLTVTVEPEPSRVKIVTETGVSATEGV